MAEAYDGDPSKLFSENVLDALLDSGFDAVYDGETYETIKHTVEGEKWANDIDEAANPFSERFHKVLRYAENHDEVRLASKQHWAGSGMEIGKPVSAVLFGLGRGPLMIYNGQEVGEQADGAEGFAGDDGRSSIFDYGTLPALVPWVNGHRYDGGGLTEKQKELRAYYARLLKLCAEPDQDGYLPLPKMSARSHDHDAGNYTANARKWFHHRADHSSHSTCSHGSAHKNPHAQKQVQHIA